MHPAPVKTIQIQFFEKIDHACMQAVPSAMTGPEPKACNIRRTSKDAQFGATASAMLDAKYTVVIARYTGRLPHKSAKGAQKEGDKP